MCNLRVFGIAMISVLFSIFTGCSAVSNSPMNEEKITVAKAQKEIKIGMPSSDVAEILGAPNMVTTDAERREVWVYDKVSTQIQSSRSSAGVWLLVFGASSNSYNAASSQKTLTIIVKFDEKGLVRDFSYRTSSF